jgi:uroporphyrinogen-III decarboxylase
LAFIKERTLGKTALQGGVDSHLLLIGTPGEVRDETTRVIEILKPGGGYICGQDQGFPNYPPENIAAMVDTAIKLGKY